MSAAITTELGFEGSITNAISGDRLGHPQFQDYHSGMSARAIAFYLPQFHPIRENNEWWGAGFTEWTNVAKARPLFRGHIQPHIPADLGFYDLRLPESREAQADLAKRYGVEAFCYWHYWFGGRRILQRPFDEVLTSGKPDHKFCVGWANQSWSGIWDGAPNRVLLEQTYPGSEDDKRHFNHLLPAFEDGRYLRVDGKPLFYVFRPEQLPDARAFCDRWRKMSESAGLKGIYLVAEMSALWGGEATCDAPEQMGFDAGVYMRLPFLKTAQSHRWVLWRRRYLRWPEVWDYAKEPLNPPEKYVRPDIFPCVYPNWDNTPRSGRRGLVVRGSHPELFRVQVRHAVDRLKGLPAENRLLFIKSWNEWAEGNYLEPDTVHGHGYLSVLHDELTVRARNDAVTGH